MARSVVMVVDANPATARRVQRALEGTDLELRSASGMRDAIDHADDPDLVAIFTAVSISGGNGYELTRRVVELRPDLAVYMLWGGFEAFDEDRALVAGVRAGLRRPFSSEAILALIEEQLGALPVSEASLEPMEPLEELLPVDSIEPLDTGALTPVEPTAPPVGDERLAAFVPADYDEIPPVRVDREEISVGLERAVLAVLPEVLELLLAKAATNPGPVRAAIREAVDESVSARLPGLVHQAMKDQRG
jgi:CheY-like chemotaxis protein